MNELEIDFEAELAIRLGQIVHEKCNDAPHDIGDHLAKEVFLYRLEQAGKRGASAGAELRERFYNEYIVRKIKRSV